MKAESLKQRFSAQTFSFVLPPLFLNRISIEIQAINLYYVLNYILNEMKGQIRNAHYSVLIKNNGKFHIKKGDNCTY